MIWRLQQGLVTRVITGKAVRKKFSRLMIASRTLSPAIESGRSFIIHEQSAEGVLLQIPHSCDVRKFDEPYDAKGPVQAEV